MRYRAVLFDLGGVLFESPMRRFAEYERAAGLPDGLIRRINAANPNANAWARAERGEISEAEFLQEFEREARDLGFEVDARHVVAALDGGAVHQEMVSAARALRGAGLRLAAVTNNMAPLADSRPDLVDVIELFDVVVESSVEGIRKPELGFYRLALDRVGVEPERCIYLDDLGINLKPGRLLGMTTVKVADPAAAVAELERCVGIALR